MTRIGHGPPDLVLTTHDGFPRVSCDALEKTARWRSPAGSPAAVNRIESHDVPRGEVDQRDGLMPHCARITNRSIDSLRPVMARARPARLEAGRRLEGLRHHGPRYSGW